MSVYRNIPDIQIILEKYVFGMGLLLVIFFMILKTIG